MNTSKVATATALSFYIAFTGIYLKCIIISLVSNKAIDHAALIGATALFVSFAICVKIAFMHRIDRKDMIKQQAEGFKLLWRTFHITVFLPVLAVSFLVGTASSIVYVSILVVFITLIYAQIPKKETAWEVIDK